MEKIGDRIGKLMKSKGYTQKELACLVGVTEGAMSRYLSNAREPKIDVIANLATVLNTTADFLIRGEVLVSSFDEVYQMISLNAKNMNEKETLKLIEALTSKQL